MKLHNISLGNIRRRKGKMIFLALGLIIGIATIVTLLSITDSMGRDIEERLNKFGANIVMVPRSDTLSLSYGGINVGGVSYETREFEQNELEKIRTIKNAKNLGVVAPKVLGAVEARDRRVLLMGVVFEQELSLKTWWQKQGRFPETADELLLGASAATVLEAEPGETLVLNGRPFGVAGVLLPTGGRRTMP